MDIIELEQAKAKIEELEIKLKNKTKAMDDLVQDAAKEITNKDKQIQELKAELSILKSRL
jgi:predicted RNase H-like nuclease (RuvC/YqgF family)